MRAIRNWLRTKYGPKVTPHIFIFDRERKLRYEGRIDDNMRGNNIKTNDARNALDALIGGRPVPVEHTPVFGCSTKWNAAVAGKQQEMKEWMAKPVTLETVSLDELKKLRDESDRQDVDDQLLGDVVRSVPDRVSGAADHLSLVSQP